MFLKIKNKDVLKLKRNGIEMWGYYLNYIDEDDKTNKERRGSVKWSKDDALKAANDRLLHLKNLDKALLQKDIEDEDNLSRMISEITFEEVFLEYLEAKFESDKHKIRTDYDMKRVAYKHMIPKFTMTTKDSFGNITNKSKPIAKIGKSDISEWRKYLINATYSQGSGNNTIVRHYSNNQIKKIQVQCKSVFNYALNQGYIEINPFRYFDTITSTKHKDVKKTVPQILNKEQYKHLLSVIENSEEDELKKRQFLLLVSLEFSLGLRLGECLSLRVDDICQTTGDLIINKSWNNVHNLITAPKTKNSYRMLLVGDITLIHLRNLINYYEDAGIYWKDMPLFTSFTTCKRREGQLRLSPNTVRRNVAKYLKLAGLNHMRIHDFRHSCTSTLHNESVPTSIASKVLGDSERTTAEVYAHINRDTLKLISKMFE